MGQDSDEEWEFGESTSSILPLRQQTRKWRSDGPFTTRVDSWDFPENEDTLDYPPEKAHGTHIPGKARPTGPSKSTCPMDTFEEAKWNTRMGKTMTSLSELVDLLARNGVAMALEKRIANLRDTCIQVGSGSQFAVFRELESETNILGLKNVVYKRVKITRSELNEEKDMAVNEQYRRGMRHLELEIRALCHERFRTHRNIVHLLAWGCKIVATECLALLTYGR